MAEYNVVRKAIEGFDAFGYYTDRKIGNDIEQNRKGQFALSFEDESGKPLSGVKVKVRQKTHEFKFGCTTFNLDRFGDGRDKIYRDKLASLFNCGVVPLYWDTLEPEEGHPRFEHGCADIPRRPPLDDAVSFCVENGMSVKGHCLVYNSFQPSWLSDDNRIIKQQIDRRLKAIADRYGNAFEFVDVINEMLTIYKNCYRGNGMRNLQVADERDHEKWSFELCKRYFPLSKLFWNEGAFESFGDCYRGYRSFYYMELQRQLSLGTPIEGIGMQYHIYCDRNDASQCGPQNICNPLRLMDVLDRYGDFGLPIHISEISVPSWSNGADDEECQAELVKRLYSLWFSSKSVTSAIWWNFADGTAYRDENRFFAGLLRNDCSEKPSYKALEALIKKVWHTEFETVADGRLNFRGFYGDYEVEAIYGGRKTVRSIRLCSDTTGYDNSKNDFRIKHITL